MKLEVFTQDTYRSDDRVLINMDNIAYVVGNVNGSTIYLAAAGADPEVWVRVKENLDEIMRMGG